MAIKFVETDPAVYEQQLIQAYENITGRTLNPADPERLLINLLTYAITLCAINIDETGRLNLLATSKGEYLDRLGELVGCKRLQPQRAQTTLRFSIVEPLGFDVVIPEGTRVGADEENIFYTTQEAKIVAGNTSVDVQAEFITEGSKGNGFSVGQINKMIDVIPYISSVSNITMSMHGTDTETDDRYRERIRESLERFSSAGPSGAYRHHTMSVHQDIIDVSVWSPSPGQVKITFIMKDGEIPNNDMIQLVMAHLNDEKIRPLTDQVIVEVPEVVTYSISFTYYINRGFEALQGVIANEINEKVNEFVLWTKKKLGRDILPERLTEYIMSINGVHSIDISSPLKTTVNANQIAHCQSINIQYGGVKE
jgi:phage-related baseplate assembly protein